MFTSFKQERQLLLLDEEIELEIVDSDVDVVLSPSLYWVRRFSLPTDSLKEAKKLLPSLFEEFLPQGVYSYYGFFDESGFVAFAYDESSIRHLLQQKGLSLAKVKDLYFAQNEIQKDSLPMKISQKSLLADVDAIILKLPASFAQESLKSVEFLPKRSSHRVKIEQFGSFVETKILYKMSALLFLFAPTSPRDLRHC